MVIQKKSRILIIEDDDDIRELIEFSIKKHFPQQFKIEQYNNAELALSCAFKNIYHLIIVDFKLQEMTGLDFIKTIRMFPKSKDVPVVFISGYSLELKEKSDINEFSNLYFLEKPFEVDELVERIKHFSL